MATEFDTITTPFGAFLRQLRIAAGLTQEALAERAGLSARGLSDLERGARASPRADTLQLLIVALALAPSERAALVAAARQSALPPHGRLARRAALSQAEAAFPGAPLSAPTEPLLGRETAVREVTALLHTPANRVVTLTGPGGVGKTRLALQVAAESRDDFPGGVAFVPLAAIRDPALVLPTVAQALGVREGAERTLEEGLAVVLRERRVLLVLDNLEQVLEAAPVIGQLLTACPELCILATSRVPLRLSDEQRYPVPPLALTDSTEVSRDEASAASPAVTLFVQRARRVRPDFAVTADNAPAVTGLCRRLDGLPLAIELAAPRVAVLSPVALLARFERALPLLSEGARDQPERLQTMRNAIAWSYDLLPAAVQVLFRQLAVFEGGFALDAAEVVCDIDGGDFAVLDGVVALVENSMLHAEDGIGGEMRFTMLETIREFGLEQLTASGEVAQVRDRHAAWMLALAEQAVNEYFRADQQRWWERVEVELPNMRAALAWYEQQCDGERHQRLAGAFQLFALTRGYLREAQDMVTRAVANQGETTAGAKSWALFGGSMIAWFRGDYQQTRIMAAEAREVARDGNDAFGVAMAQFALAEAAWTENDLPQALILGEEAIARLREVDASIWLSIALADMGTVALIHGDCERGDAWIAEGLALTRARGDRWFVANKLCDLGAIAVNNGNLAEAARHLGESVRLYGQLRDTWYLASPLCGIAAIAVAIDQPEAAARLLGTAARLREASGSAAWPWEQARDDQTVAAARAALGDEAYAHARAAGREVSVSQAVAEAVTITDRVTGDGEKG
ncbi:MAG: helix-turn-helix domain-containing protein [Thermomicrobiales bacterium]